MVWENILHQNTKDKELEHLPKRFDLVVKVYGLLIQIQDLDNTIKHLSSGFMGIRNITKPLQVLSQYKTDQKTKAHVKLFPDDKF